MKFAYPEFLYALLALAVPIIIHLFNFRKHKRIAFSNISFLKASKEETNAKSQLKHLLVLLSRLLALAALILAFCQPYFPDNEEKYEKVHSIFIDNSFSMTNKAEDGELLALAKSMAEQLLNNIEETERVQILTHNFSSQEQHLYSKKEALTEIQNIEVTTKSRSWDEIIARQISAVQEETAFKELYFLSDFQEHMFDKEIMVDSSYAATAYRLDPQHKRNVYIDSCWFASPPHVQNQEELVGVRIKNLGDQNIDNLSLSLLINGAKKNAVTISLKANQAVDTVVSYVNPETDVNATFEITDYPIVFDDKFYFTKKHHKNLKVRSISDIDSSKTLSYAIYRTEPFFDYKPIPLASLNYDEINEADFLILEQIETLSSGLINAVQDHLKRGKNILVIPSSSADQTSYNELLSIANFSIDKADTATTKVGDLNKVHPLFANVFEKLPNQLNLPQVSLHFGLNQTAEASSTSILTLENGTDLISEWDTETAAVFFMNNTGNEADGNLASHGLTLPILYRIALSSLKLHQPYTSLDKETVVTIPNAVNLVEGKTMINGATSFIPMMRKVGLTTQLILNEQIGQAGHYSVSTNDSIVHQLALNFPRNESQIAYASEEEIGSSFKNLYDLNLRSLETSTSIASASIEHKNDKIWPYLILMALIFFLIEITLIRLLK